MAFSASNDRRIADLIDQVQKYSNPTGQNPKPPSLSYPSPGRADDLLDRAQPPWFEPIEHHDDREVRSDEHSAEVPIIDGDGEVPDPSAEEESRIGDFGVDALAYYAPFHFFRQNQWGVYIRDYGIAYLASRFLKRRMLTPSDNWALRCAYWLLFEHEYFHFQTEVAATHYELLTGDPKAYEYLFYDKHATWLEESMANASALQKLKGREDALLTVSQIESFKDFAASWMKKQAPGYRDFDKWYEPRHRMQHPHLWGRDTRGRNMRNGRAALTSRLHEISCHTRQKSSLVASDVLRPYANADYTAVPVVRLHDSRFPWLKSGRPFPKSYGLEVIIHTNDHPPPHIHVEFSDGSKPVKVEWPTLSPFDGERCLSKQERKKLRRYVGERRNDIVEKLEKVFERPNMPSTLSALKDS
jgi:hypothetical protein